LREKQEAEKHKIAKRRVDCEERGRDKERSDQGKYKERKRQTWESDNEKGDRKGEEVEGNGEYFKDKKGNIHERGNGNKGEGKK
jgi:hypothetical protein